MKTRQMIVPCLVIVLLLMPRVVHAQDNPPCGTVITTAGAVVNVDTAITCSFGQSWLTVSASNVTVNLTYSGSVTGSGAFPGGRTGIDAEQAPGLTIQGGGSISAFRYGVYLNQSPMSTVTNITFVNNAQGVVVLQSPMSTVTNTNMTFANSGSQEQTGVYIVGSDDVKLALNDIEGQNNARWGVYISGSQNARIERNHIAGCGSFTASAGIFIIGQSQAFISRNQVTGNRTGLYSPTSAGQVTDVTVVDNEFSANATDGIFIEFAIGDAPNGTQISSNLVQNNGRDGIHIRGISVGTRTEDNEVSFNGRFGISVEGVTGTHNWIVNNQVGPNGVADLAWDQQGTSNCWKLNDFSVWATFSGGTITATGGPPLPPNWPVCTTINIH